jgi:hypothetical protein
MAQAWYQGGTSVFDFTDPAHPVEIAFFDRGPLNPDQVSMGGHWGTYWYNGHLYASELSRGLDIFRLTPNEHLSANEIAAAAEVHLDTFNPQHQTRIEWPASVTVARAYMDQLTRSGAISAAQASGLDSHLESGDGLTHAADFLDAAAGTAASSIDAERMRLLSATLRELAR